jgi:hypothetical protein
MSRALLLARARTAALKGMVDACTIRHRAGETTDDDSGVVTPIWEDLYAGPCRVQQSRYSSSTKHDAGQDDITLLALEVHLPMSVVGVEVGDAITMTASLTDPDLPGRVFLVRSLAHKTDASARRVQVIERTG